MCRPSSFAVIKELASRERVSAHCYIQTLMMLYLLKTPPALPPSRCSLMVLCI